jgi:hypothetical protein
MTINAIMRLVGTLCFLLAYFGVNPAGYPVMDLGLALWCGSTLVP